MSPYEGHFAGLKTIAKTLQKVDCFGHCCFEKHMCLSKVMATVSVQVI